MSFFNVLAGLLAAGSSGGGGTTFPQFTAIRALLIGDSINQFNNRTASPSAAATYTRDATGIVTGATATSNQLFGTQQMYLFGFVDPSYEIVARNNYNATSTLGATAGGTAGVAMYGPNLGAGTTTVSTNASVTDFGRFSHRGSFHQLQSRLKGSIELVANLGRGGNVAPFTTETAQIANFPTANLVIYEGGTNNAKALANGATIFAAIKADLDVIRASGLPCLVKLTPPLGATAGSYVAINAQINISNGLVLTECAAHPTQLLPSDNWLATYDAPNTCMLAAFSLDGTHNNAGGSIACGDADYTAIAPYVTVSTTLSSSAADTGRSVNGHTCLLARGPWVGTTQASGHAGGSGTVPSGWESGTLAPASTTVSNVFQDGNGFWNCQNLITATATGGKSGVWPWGAGGVTVATLGISKTDGAEYALEMEIDWSGATAAGAGLIGLSMATNGSGQYGTVTSGESIEAAGVLPDAMTGRVLRTGWLQMSDTNITLLVPALFITFNAVTGSALTLNVRRVSILKR